jgi:putative membrane protein
MKILIKWLISTTAILITAYLLPGVVVDGFVSALIAALVLGLINAFLKPIFVILTLPINILSLGLFTFVINALLVMLMAALVSGFAVASFWSALLFGIVLAIINWFLSQIFK